VKAQRIVCGAPLIEGAEHRKKLGWRKVSCDLAPGHQGNHMARTKTAFFQWWNKEKNPQKEKR
jgi:hypothetical protein